MHFRNHTGHDIMNNVKIITSCCIGEIIPLEKLSNDVFSSMILGDGFGVVPAENDFFSPVSGIIKDVSANNHEITIKSDDDLIIIVSVEPEHAGADFDICSKVQPGDHVMQGDSLWTIDINFYKESDNIITAAVIVTNSDSLPSFNIRYGRVKTVNQPVMTITV